MKNHKEAVPVLADVAENLQNQMDKTNARANVIISKNKMQTLNEYVLIFIENFNNIIKIYNLTKTEIVIVLKILEYMKFGNLISMTNATLARDLEMDRSNISKCIKKLKKTELIVELNGNLYFNPHIASKGVFDERKPEDNELLDFTAIELTEHGNNATVSIATNNIRKKFRQKPEQKLVDNEIQKKIDDFYKPSYENDFFNPNNEIRNL